MQRSEGTENTSEKEAEQGPLYADMQASREAILGFSSLTKNLEKMFTVRGIVEGSRHCVDAMAVNTAVSRNRQQKGKCNSCVKQGNEKCVQCFKCG